MRVTHPTPIAGYAPRRRALVTAILGAALLMASLGSVGAQASPPPAADPAAISYWNDIAVKVITIDAGKANAEGFMWLGFTQAAVYNAVVGITRDYKLYKWHAHARKHASPEAAAGAAAFGVLMEYFGANPAAVTATERRLRGRAPGDPGRQVQGPRHRLRRTSGRPPHPPARR